MLSRYIEAAHVPGNWLAVAAAGVAVVAYFLGCFNGAVVVSRFILRDDVRAHGSGNAGLTNFYRTFGGPLTAVVILSDVVKAVLAVLFAVFIAEHISPELVPLAKYWAGTFCLLGHMYPCTFQFRGGKGILSGGTIAIMMGIDGQGLYPAWWIPVVVWGGFIILAVATRYVSLGSCWAGLSFPFVSAIIYQDTLITLLSVVVGGLILWKHRANMVRIAKGAESKFTLHKKPAEASADGDAADADAPEEDEPQDGEAPATDEPQDGDDPATDEPQDGDAPAEDGAPSGETAPAGSGSGESTPGDEEGRP